jgi:hypothetical protein
MILTGKIERAQHIDSWTGRYRRRRLDRRLHHCRTDPAQVIVRAIGPSLTAFGVDGALADPILELHGQDGSLIFQNDNWRSDQEEEIIGSTIPPTDDRESAIIATLPPGLYTAVIRGAAGGTGVALVEVYNLETP